MSEHLSAGDLEVIEAFVFHTDTVAMSVEQKMEYLTGLGTSLGRLLREVRRLRQGLWDCVVISGADTDGDTTPDAMTGDLVEYTKREVQILRDSYEECLSE